MTAREAHALAMERGLAVDVLGYFEEQWYRVLWVPSRGVTVISWEDG